MRVPADELGHQRGGDVVDVEGGPARPVLPGHRGGALGADPGVEEHLEEDVPELLGDVLDVPLWGLQRGAALQTPEGHVEDVAEELGDVLFQVLFHARVGAEGATPVAGEDGASWPPFDIDDVAATLVAKLVRRHPHVFGDSDASTPEEVQAQWQEIKAAERAAKAARRR